MPKRLLIVTDSLGAPRCEPATVSYEETWVYPVKKHFEGQGYDVFCITYNGLHAGELLSLAETKLTLYHADIAILQCGLVDCAPRVMTEREMLVVRLLHIQKPVKFLAHKYHAALSKWRNISLYTVEQFDERIAKTVRILKSGKKCIVVQVPIAPACNGYLAKSPLIATNIKKFNAVLEKNSDSYLKNFENFSADDADPLFMDDFHHLNTRGHKILADIVIKAFPTMLNADATT